MSQENIRRELAAKRGPIRIDSKRESVALDFTTSATTGTFDAATAAVGLKIEINGTAYKLPAYTV